MPWRISQIVCSWHVFQDLSIFASEARAYPSETHYDARLYGSAATGHTNIGIARIYFLSGKNTFIKLIELSVTNKNNNDIDTWGCIRNSSFSS